MSPFARTRTSIHSHAQLIGRPRILILMLVVIPLQIREGQKPVHDIVHGQPDAPDTMTMSVCDVYEPPYLPVGDVDEPRDTHQVHQPPPGPSHEARRACFSKESRPIAEHRRLWKPIRDNADTSGETYAGATAILMDEDDET